MSKIGLGAVLPQVGDDDKVHPIQYASRTMTEAERNNDTSEREMLAVVFALQPFRVYLLSTTPFILVSDHKSIKDTSKKRYLHGKLMTWLEFIAECEFSVKYRPGKENIPTYVL